MAHKRRAFSPLFRSPESFTSAFSLYFFHEILFFQFKFQVRSQHCGVVKGAAAGGGRGLIGLNIILWVQEATTLGWRYCPRILSCIHFLNRHVLQWSIWVRGPISFSRGAKKISERCQACLSSNSTGYHGHFSYHIFTSTFVSYITKICS